MSVGTNFLSKLPTTHVCPVIFPVQSNVRENLKHNARFAMVVVICIREGVLRNVQRIRHLFIKARIINVFNVMLNVLHVVLVS